MKILILLPQVARDASGGHKVILEYANKLVEYGHCVSVDYFYGISFQSYHLPESIRKLLVRIYVKFVGSRHWFSLNASIKERVISDITMLENADIVIATSIETAIELSKINRPNLKKFYFIQDFENWNYSNNEVYASYSAGMTNIVVAKWLKEIVDEHSSTPSYLVSNCINIELFNDKGLKRRKHSIVFHYRSADYKGPRYALEAIRKLKDKYNNLTVDVISTEDRPEDLPEFCNFHHSISASEVAEINNRTEVFMCTTVEEGFGLPGLEAMACGCAIVSSSYRGVLEYAADGENALLSPVRDVDAMVTNIVKLFEDDELRKKIAENGIKTGKERSLEKSAKEFESILMEEYEK